MDIVLTTLTFGLFGSLFLTSLLLVQHAMGFEHSVRDADGKFDYAAASRPAQLMPVILIVLMVAVPFVALRTVEPAPGPVTASLVAYGVFFIVNLWDLVIIDWLVLLVIRPGFLGDLPETPYFTTFRPHLEGWLRGNVIGLVPTAVAVGLHLLAPG